MIKVFFIHGFNVRDGGAGTVGQLMRYFPQCKTVLFSYGHFGFFKVRLYNNTAAKQFAERIKESTEAGCKVIVVAHSNGCAITQLAAERHGASIDKVIYINPALDRDARFPQSIRSVDVWHSLKDRVVKFAAFLPFHSWGDMGAYGATRFDLRVRNFCKAQNYDMPSAKHSDVFSERHHPYFGPIIAWHGLERI